MRAFLVTLLIMFAVPARMEHRGDPKPSLDEQILGEWIMIHYSRNGKPDRNRHGESWTFNRVHVHVRATDGETDDQTYRLDTTKSPANVDFIIDSSGRAKVIAIAKIEDGQLPVCYTPRVYGERPTVFASPPEGGIRLAVFTRRLAK